MPTATYAADRMAELLAGATTALAVTRTGVPLPSTTLLTHGPPVVPVTGCADRLVVYCDRPSARFKVLSGVTTSRGVQRGPVHVEAILQLVVEVWRCVPGLGNDGEEPSDASLSASASALAIDMWALWTGLKQAIDAKTLFPGGFQQQLAEIGDPIPLGPQGRMAGWKISVEVPASDIGPP